MPQYPNHVWYADITYVWIKDDVLYLQKRKNTIGVLSIFSSISKKSSYYWITTTYYNHMEKTYKNRTVYCYTIKMACKNSIFGCFILKKHKYHKYKPLKFSGLQNFVNLRRRLEAPA